MRDIYGAAVGPMTNGRKGSVITPSNADFATGIAKAVVCLAEGDITLVPALNDPGVTLTFTGCPVGFVPPFMVRRVTAATGSWATVED